MLRAGMIRKSASGLYTWLPMGLKVLRKVERIVREEMHAAGALEILMPGVQPSELWKESGRWEEYGLELLRLEDRHGREFCLGPTHEEIITDLVRNELHSYKQLPITLYQIQTKFRDEIRPRFGVMRSREFIMKDAYSFHLDSQSLQATYERMHLAYSNIFTRLGLEFRVVQADSGSIGGNQSHEFHVLADSGEDDIVFSDDSSSSYAANIEKAEVSGDPSPDKKGSLVIKRGIEVGHIFQLGTKYSQALNCQVMSEQGKPTTLTMGCYGIGISRIIAAAIEQNFDEKGIIWNNALAPFTVVLIPLKYETALVRKITDELYEQLLSANIDVLLDDRDKKTSPGIKFADMELIGIPHRLVISERNLASNQIEYKNRMHTNAELISVDEIINKIKTSLS
ncbi:UNVERIFIED_CONTAM: hypothetical protein GTU68_033938 [Idotea baltica]|nr:hypothetical protein [Idotea baltica]